MRLARFFRALTLLGLMGVPATAAGQAATLADLARARWNDGAAALAKGDLQSAMAAFHAAYDTLPDPEFAQSLGVVEYRTHHYADAARHLQIAIDCPALTREERRWSKKSLQTAVEHVGTLVVDADPSGVDVLVDGELIGRTPLPLQGWWLDVGGHIVSVRKTGYTDSSHTSEIAAGETVRLSFRLERLAEHAPAPVAYSATMAISSMSAPSPPGDQPVRAPGDNDAPSNGRTVALITGTTLTVISAGVGGYLLLRRSADQDRAGDLHRDVVATVGPNGCSSQPRLDLCQHLAQSYNIVDRDRKWAMVSFGAAGVLGASTVAAFFLWPRSHTSLHVAPLGRGWGIGVTGDFE